MSPTMALIAVAVTVAVGVVNFVAVIGMTRQAARTQRALVALSRFVVTHVAGVVPREVEDLLANVYGGGNHRGR
jgi:hypothetical protein